MEDNASSVVSHPTTEQKVRASALLKAHAAQVSAGERAALASLGDTERTLKKATRKHQKALDLAIETGDEEAIERALNRADKLGVDVGY